MKIHIFGFLLVALLVAGCMGGQTQTTDTTLPAVQTQTTIQHVATTAGSIESTVESQSTTLAQTTNQQVQTTTTAASAGTFIAKTSDVPAGSSVDFTYNGDKAILVNFGGKYVAYSNKCTHKGAATKFDGQNMVCPLHGSKFSPKDGSVLNGPAATPLTQIPVEVAGDSVYAK